MNCASCARNNKQFACQRELNDNRKWITKFNKTPDVHKLCRRLMSNLLKLYRAVKQLTIGYFREPRTNRVLHPN